MQVWIIMDKTLAPWAQIHKQLLVTDRKQTQTWKMNTMNGILKMTCRRLGVRHSTCIYGKCSQSFRMMTHMTESGNLLYAQAKKMSINDSLFMIICWALYTPWNGQKSPEKHPHLGLTLLQNLHKVSNTPSISMHCKTSQNSLHLTSPCQGICSVQRTSHPFPPHHHCH